MIILFINSYFTYSQEFNNVDKWKEYIEDLANESSDQKQLETLYAELSYLVEHPYDLNTVTAKELSRLPFLTDRQIEQLISYREKYGNMFSIYELKGVKDMDFQTIQLILPFVYIGEKHVDKRSFNVKNLLKYGNNELYIRYDQCFQQKKGYCSYPDSILNKYPNRKYLGEPFYTSFRYSYEYEDCLQAGLIAEKDAGESFLNKTHKGYDFYSFHILLKDRKWLKTAILGDYKVSFGQGLVISNDFSPSRSALVAQAERRNNGFKRHFSTNECDFFRGFGCTLNWSNLDLNLFFSSRKMDASVHNDTIPTVKKDGLHRLQRDWDKRHTLQMYTFGGNIRWAHPNYHIGLTTIYYNFGGKTVFPKEYPYNKFYFRGRNNLNMSVDYMLKNKWGKIYGETAFSQNGAIATLNAIQLTPVSYLSLLALHRFYDRRYQSFFGNSFSQNGSVQNEQGIYLGCQWVPFEHWKLSLYADFYHFPWLKYNVDYPSTGKEYMIQLDYTPTQHFSSSVRYKGKEKDVSGKQHRFRGQSTYLLTTSWKLRTSIDGVLLNTVDKNNFGYMIAQSIGWKPANIPLQTDVYLAWFSTDNYATRISSYEKNLLYAFSMPSFYGKGIRFAFSFNWNIVRNITFSAKLAHSWYSDRDKIGTDTEEINGKSKTDLYAFLRWKF